MAFICSRGSKPSVKTQRADGIRDILECQSGGVGEGEEWMS